MAFLKQKLFKYAVFFLAVTIMGVSPKLATMVTGDVMMWGGGFLGFAIFAGLVGMFIGKASE